MTARRSRIRKVQPESTGASLINRTSLKKSLAIGFIILGLIILIAIVTTVVVMLLSRDSEKTTISATTPTTMSTTTHTTMPTSTTTQNTRCFYPDFDFQQRNITGVELAVSNIPWQVQVLVDDTYACGGTILDNLTILSAAHCFEKQYTPSIIRAGSIKYGNGGQASYSYLGKHK